MRKLAPTAPKRPLAEVALGLVARAEHTPVQLRRKLVQRGYNLQEIYILIEDFQAKNYLNEARAAALLVRRRAKDSKWGAQRIRQDLQLKGVGPETGAAALTHLEEGADGEGGHDWLATATALARAKFPKPWPEDATERRKEWARRVGFLQRRGFSGGQAVTAVKAAGAPADDGALAAGADLD